MKVKGITQLYFIPLATKIFPMELFKNIKIIYNIY